MSIKYTVVENSLVPGTFYPRPVQLTTRDLEILIRNVSDETTIAPPDVEAVVRAFTKEIVQGVLDGDRVSIDDFADFSPRLNQVLNSAGDLFDPASGGALRIAATIKPQLTRDIRSVATFEKIVTPDKRPLPKTFFDHNSKLVGVYSPNAIGQIDGKNLKTFDPNAPDEGVFFVDPATNESIKAVQYQNNGNRKLVFLVPDNLSGPKRIEVRARYTPNGDLRVGALKNPHSPA